MTRLRQFSFLFGALLLECGETRLQGQTTNLPPEVSISWPRRNCSYEHYTFTPGTIIKVKAEATDLDGDITQVQFFADTYNPTRPGTNLVSIATNSPYSMIWKVGPSGSTAFFKAVAVDNRGATTESLSVWTIVSSGLVTVPVFEITSPVDGGIFTLPGTFEFRAELLASPDGDTGQVQFFAGANSVGIVTQSGSLTNTTPPYSVTVTNLPEGEYNLWLRKDNFATAYFASGYCGPPAIRVTKLGLNVPKLTAAGQFAFDVVTSFPTNQNIIEASSNLLDWFPISTNVPFTNTFTFTDLSPATNSPRSYRAVVPSQ